MKYIKPEINIKRFSTESIVTASGDITNTFDPELQRLRDQEGYTVAQVSFTELTAFNN